MVYNSLLALKCIDSSFDCLWKSQIIFVSHSMSVCLGQGQNKGLWVKIRTNRRNVYRNCNSLQVYTSISMCAFWHQSTYIDNKYDVFVRVIEKEDQNMMFSKIMPVPKALSIYLIEPLRPCPELETYRKHRSHLEKHPTTKRCLPKTSLISRRPKPQVLNIWPI